MCILIHLTVNYIYQIRKLLGRNAKSGWKWSGLRWSLFQCLRYAIYFYLIGYLVKNQMTTFSQYQWYNTWNDYEFQRAAQMPSKIRTRWESIVGERVLNLVVWSWDIFTAQYVKKWYTEYIFYINTLSIFNWWYTYEHCALTNDYGYF